ncbi:EscN/YscN/HrcN family type III secretion system ATPase, partial [Burkholderia sp. SIMBA_043]
MRQVRGARAARLGVLVPLSALAGGALVLVTDSAVLASGLDATLGELCELRSPEGALLQRADVVGFSRDVALLSPFGRLGSVSRATRVVGLRRPLSLR